MGNETSRISETSAAGSLHIRIGPMYAGKTSKLIETYEDCLDNDENTIVLTHSAEIRYSVDNLSTHDQKNIPCLKCDTIKSFLDDHIDKIKDCRVILIDEGQFFTDISKVLTLVDNLHKHVFIFGLDGDFKQNKFGHILDLIPHCDSIEKLHAVCSVCNERACFSHRTIESNEQIIVGSQGIYQSLCRKCYNYKTTS